MDIWAYLRTNYETIVSLTALAISIYSIWLTYKTLSIQRKHNKLSVKPIPEILLFYTDEIKIELKNLGVGPLRCLELTTKDTSGTIKHHMRDFVPAGLVKKGTVFTNRRDFTILPAESIILLSITEINPIQEDNARAILEALSSLTLHLVYTSIYDEVFTPYEKSLSWLKPENIHDDNNLNY